MPGSELGGRGWGSRRQRGAPAAPCLPRVPLSPRPPVTSRASGSARDTLRARRTCWLPQEAQHVQRPRGLGGTVQVVCGQGLGSPLRSHQLLLPQPHAWPPLPPGRPAGRPRGWLLAPHPASSSPSARARNRLEQKDPGSQDATRGFWRHGRSGGCRAGTEGAEVLVQVPPGWQHFLPSQPQPLPRHGAPEPWARSFLPPAGPAGAWAGSRPRGARTPHEGRLCVRPTPSRLRLRGTDSGRRGWGTARCRGPSRLCRPPSRPAPRPAPSPSRRR